MLLLLGRLKLCKRYRRSRLVKQTMMSMVPMSTYRQTAPNVSVGVVIGKHRNVVDPVEAEGIHNSSPQVGEIMSGNYDEEEVVDVEEGVDK